MVCVAGGVAMTEKQRFSANESTKGRTSGSASQERHAATAARAPDELIALGSRAFLTLAWGPGVKILTVLGLVLGQTV